MNYVIIGNSASGTAAIESIRKIDKKGSIIIISDESFSNYSRPLISYLLGKKVDNSGMSYRDMDFYKNNKVKLLLNKKATKLNIKKKQVVLSDKKRISYDKLLISTGGIPIIPDIQGLNSNGVFTFTKLKDVYKIREYINAQRVKKAVVIGGGLIGLKVTGALLELDITVTIIELADRILFTAFDRKASEITENALKKIGVDLITNNTIIEIKKENNRVKEVILKDNNKISCDMVIVAIGVSPNIEIVKNTSIKTNKGIVVNKYMNTTIKDIYAAGDCCEAKNSLLNINRTIAIWPLAVK